jgi:mannose-6-phosphate isomerase-like protein (cupin superfamily)
MGIIMTSVCVITSKMDDTPHMVVTTRSQAKKYCNDNPTIYLGVLWGSKMTHKHNFSWYILNGRLDVDNPKRKKVIKCITCNKSLDDIVYKLGLKKWMF